MLKSIQTGVAHLPALQASGPVAPFARRWLGVLFFLESDGSCLQEIVLPLSLSFRKMVSQPHFARGCPGYADYYYARPTHRQEERVYLDTNPGFHKIHPSRGGIEPPEFRHKQSLRPVQIHRQRRAIP
jgi:hypothetical protein